MSTERESDAVDRDDHDMGDSSGHQITPESEQDIDSDGDHDPDPDMYMNFGGFEISRSLPRRDEYQMTIRHMIKLLHSGLRIRVSPLGEREKLPWSNERQIGLIDSLFQDHYISPLIFEKRIMTISGVEKEVMICVDGRQRLMSVKRFINGHIPCHDRHGKRWWFRHVGGRPIEGRKYLSQAAQGEFCNKEFLCYGYFDMTENQERDLSERVQRGNPLTSAEGAQAQEGDWQSLARKFLDDFPRVVNLSDNRRGAGFDKIISSFVQILEAEKLWQGQRVPLRGTKAWVKKVCMTDASMNPCTTYLKNRMQRTFDRFEELVRKNKRAFEHDDLPPKATIEPVEFVAIAYVIDKYGGEMNNDQLEQAIREMRRHVRRWHPNNMRRNTIVWDDLMTVFESHLGGGENGHGTNGENGHGTNGGNGHGPNGENDRGTKREASEEAADDDDRHRTLRPRR